MKRKKINRGFILSMALLFGVFIYIISIAIWQASQIKNIEAAYKDYIETECSYYILPGEGEADKKSISQAELSEYIEKMKADIKSRYIDNEAASKYLIAEIEKNLNEQIKGTTPLILTYEKTVIRRDIEFIDDTVQVTLTCNTSYKASDSDSVVHQTIDTIKLIREDGKWKVSYSNLVRPYNDYKVYDIDYALKEAF